MEQHEFIWSSALVEVQGMDPKLVKGRSQAFHTATSGRTTVSASAVVLKLGSTNSHLLAITPALVIQRFLTTDKRNALSEATNEDLLPSTIIRIQLQQRNGASRFSSPCKLLGCAHYDTIDTQLSSILQSARNTSSAWSLGWSLTPTDSDPSSCTPKSSPTICSTFALLALQTTLPDDIFLSNSLAPHNISPPRQLSTASCCSGPSITAGRQVIIQGSPFGCLAPTHFTSSHITGTISNTFSSSQTALQAPPSPSSSPAVFLLDASCFPGMEGAPISCPGCSNLLGLLLQPLSNGHLELQLAINWQHLEPLVLQHLQQLGSSITIITRSSGTGITSSSCAAAAHQQQPSTPAAAISTALQSVVMIRAAGSWASGVIISASGLLLTNAHLFQQQRTAAAAARKPHQPPPPGSDAPSYTGITCQVKLPAAAGPAGAAVWLPARLVYLFSGYLDIALLQLQLQHQQLPAVELAPEHSLGAGTRVAVLGHGLMGPATGWPASATFGNITSLVQVAGRPSLMVTTAAVHPGASGGPVVDMQGRLVGLVTSNARHSSGTTLPRLNFCIAAHELVPVVAWGRAAAMGSGDVSMLSQLDRDDAEGVRVWDLAAPGGSADGDDGPPLAGPLDKLKEIQRKVEQAYKVMQQKDRGGLHGGVGVHSRL